MSISISEKIPKSNRLKTITRRPFRKSIDLYGLEIRSKNWQVTKSMWSLLAPVPMDAFLIGVRPASILKDWMVAEWNAGACRAGITGS
jgi:hypothetical protein